MSRIQLRRGAKSDLPSSGMLAGEPLVTTDKGTLYVAIDNISKKPVVPAIDALSNIDEVSNNDLLLIQDVSYDMATKITINDFKASLNIPTTIKQTEWDNKQTVLTNTVNIKSINGQTILGSGDITITASEILPAIGIGNESKILSIKKDNSGYELSNTLLSAGITTDTPTITHTELTLNITSCECNLYDNSGATGTLKHYIIPQSNTITLVDNTVNYIYIDYNSGTPIYKNTTDVLLINESNTIPVNTILVTSGNPHLSDWDSLGNGLVNKLHKRLVKTQRHAYESGLRLSESNGNIKINSGIVWRGAKSFDLLEVNSNGTNTSYWFFYKHVSGVWTLDLTTNTYNNTQYDDGTNLVALGTGDNKFTINWIFRGVENYQHGYYILGNKGYKNLPTAIAETKIPELPTQISTHAILVGRVIVEQNSNIITVESSFDGNIFTGSVINEHNQLSGLNVGDYQHLTYSEFIIATQTASTLLDGYLTSTDWNTFNNKQPAGSYLIASDITGKEDTTNKVTLISNASTNTEYPTAKLLYDQLLTKVDTSKTINGLPLTNDITISSSGGFISKLYFCDDDMSGVVATSTIGAFPNIVWHELESTPDSNSFSNHTNITLPTNQTITQIDRYITEQLNLTELPGGEWIFDLWAYVSTGSARFDIYLYKVESNSTVTQIITTTPITTTFSNTTAALITTRMFTSAMTGWNPTDRIGVVIAAHRVSSNPTITFIHNKTTGQVSTMTSPVVVTHNQLNGLNVGNYQHLTTTEKSFLPVGTGNANKIVSINATGNGLQYISGSTSSNKFQVSIPAGGFNLTGASTEPLFIGVTGTNSTYSELQFSDASTDLTAFFEIPARITSLYANGSLNLDINFYYTETGTATFKFIFGIESLSNTGTRTSPDVLVDANIGTVTYIPTNATNLQMATVTITISTPTIIAGQVWRGYLKRNCFSGTPDTSTGIAKVMSISVYET